jgi:predicted O-methyltransferase YrrM
MKTMARFLFYRYAVAQNIFSWVAGFSSRKLSLSHLNTYREKGVCGPLQREEALFLYSLTRLLRPKVIVEFGFHYGHSSFNFLQAMGEDDHLYSFDIAESAKKIAATNFAHHKNFTFVFKSQADVSKADFAHLPIDLVFLDASHSLELNEMTFAKLLPVLAPDCIIAIHDTGTWAKKHFETGNAERARVSSPGDWLNGEEFLPARDERLFVNWLMDTHPNFSVVNLATLNTLRNGFTLVQKRRKLPV